MNPRDILLTIDLGTSGPKVCLFDCDLQLLGVAFREVPLIFTGEGGVEQDPRAWINAIELCVDELRATQGQLFSRVMGLNVTSQWSGTVMVGDQGECLGNAISWMDSRGAPYAKSLTRGFPTLDGYGMFQALNWIRITGGAPTRSGHDSVSHILFLKHERPEIYERTRVFLEPKDYLNFYLTGLSAASHDSITVHWITDNRDINRIHYSESLLRKTGLDRKKLPDLVPSNSVLGPVLPRVARRFGIPEDSLVIAGLPDLHSAAVGSGGVLDFTPHIYIGTSAWIISHVPFKKTDLFHNIASIPSGIPGRYLMVNEQQSAGASLQFLKNQVFFPDGGILSQPPPGNFYALMDELASRAPAGCDGLFFFPWLNGERSPVDLAYLRGGFVNLSLRHEQRHLFRAVMEGVALNLRWLLEYSEKFCAQKFPSLRFIGGGARSDLWASILADILNRRIEQMEDPLSSNSRGAAALAAVALGRLRLDEIPSKIKVRKSFDPNPDDRNLHDQRYQAFIRYFNAHRNWLKNVNMGAFQ
jgi:xylulokinase